MSVEIDFTKLYNEHDFPEDAKLENGNYHCKCIECGCIFTGHKRRITCKVCQNEVDRKNEHFITDGNS